MPTPFSTGPGYQVFNLIQSGAESTQLSPDETKIYVSTDSGDILVYDLATLTLVQTINVAAELQSMSLSDDGSTAYVIGAETAGGQRVVYEVNLATGASSILPGTAGLDATDVEFIDGNRLLISAAQTYIYDLSTQQASNPTGTNPVGYFSPTIMVESDGLVLIAGLGTSDGPLELYDERLGRVVSFGSSFNGPSPTGFNAGVMAVSREAGLIAQYLPVEGLKIYDLNFNFVAGFRFFGIYDGGFAFSSDGSFLIALRGDTLTTFDTTTFQPRQIFDLSGSGITLGPVNGGGVNGDAVTVTSDDTRMIVTDMSTGYVHVIVLAEPLGTDPGVVGTNGDDTLSAVLGQDVDGLAGTDRLSIDFRAAESGVTADFRALASSTSITVEGATIANIENIQRIDGSEFDDFLAIYQDFPIGDAQVFGYGGDDEIHVSVAVGSFGPQIFGGDGNDLIDARGTFQGGSYFGEAGNDTIYTGASSRASAAGGDGDDIIHSWGTADGGAGNDTITLYEPGDVSTPTPSATGGDGDDIISADLTNPFGDPASYRMAGGGGADRLTGGDGNDYITSTDFDSSSTSEEDTGSERDILFGGAGIDRLFAGFGDDVDGGDDFDILVYSFAASQSAITMNTDDLLGPGPVSIGGGTIRNMEAIDRLYGTGFDDVFTVGPNSNPPSARAQVFGAAGNDTFMNTHGGASFLGGEGNDRYVVLVGSGASDFSGGEGVDTIDLTRLTSGVTVTLSTSPFGESGSLAEASLHSVENVLGTAFADVIRGSGSANRIEGGNGNDVIDGGFGDDILIGGAGVDEVQFLHGFSGVTVSLAITTAQNTGLGFDTLSGFENLTGSNFNDDLTGDASANVIEGRDGDDVIEGGGGNDTLVGGAGTDTARYAGNFADFTVTEGAVGAFSVSGAGTDSLDGIERLRFNDVEMWLDLGEGLAIDPASDDPDTFMINIRDFDGNDLGGATSWVMIGEADANLDGSVDYIFVNREIGRFAEVAVDSGGLVRFDNHGALGDTRVVGIYIDPLVQSGDVEAGSDHDSQRRFQNDLFIGNISTVLGSEDYDGDGFAEIYFALTDGTAYLRAIMHADGNIQYANYQSEAQVIEYLTANGYDETTFGDWFATGATGSAATDAVFALDAMVEKPASLFDYAPPAVQPGERSDAMLPFAGAFGFPGGDYASPAIEILQPEFIA